MDNYGFIRVAAFSPRVFLAQPEQNAEEIVRLAGESAGRGVSIAVFPELCVCGYTCADLFAQQKLLDACEKAVLDIAVATAASGMMVAVGAPLRIAGRLYN